MRSPTQCSIPLTVFYFRIPQDFLLLFLSQWVTLTLSFDRNSFTSSLGFFWLKLTSTKVSPQKCADRQIRNLPNESPESHTLNCLLYLQEDLHLEVPGPVIQLELCNLIESELKSIPLLKRQNDYLCRHWYVSCKMVSTSERQYSARLIIC